MRSKPISLLSQMVDFICISWVIADTTRNLVKDKRTNLARGITFTEADDLAYRAIFHTTALQRLKDNKIDELI